ncbi:hypothetical protein CQW23_24690 [Capsicum baccatum]|uniref:Uncharacterized protein n=1 Tax=Capsicum baccatum TaxID=33114 RepID=A0A2G2VVH5_CAPBA|nr:hypothetical protein CQW23_24690 [Capsicum baccatum]
MMMMVGSLMEKPSTPLRLWIGGYALQCLLHVGFIWVEFQRRSFDDFDDVNFDGVSPFSLFHSREVVYFFVKDKTLLVVDLLHVTLYL